MTTSWRPRRNRAWKKQAAEAGMQRLELEKQQKKHAEAGERLRQTADLLSSQEKHVQQSAAHIHLAISQADSARNAATSAEKAANEVDYRLTICRERLELLRRKIHEEGLDTLEKRLQATQRKRDKLGTEGDTLNQSLGEKSNILKGLQQRIENQEKQAGGNQAGDRHRRRTTRAPAPGRGGLGRI